MKRPEIIASIFVGLLIIMTILLCERNKNSLVGEIVFDVPEETHIVSKEGLRIFLIKAVIEPVLDSLRVSFEKDIVLFEDSVHQMRRQLKELRKQVIEKQSRMRTMYGEIPVESRQYRKDKRDLDKQAVFRDSLEAVYSDKRERLIEFQRDYNNVIATLIDNKVLLKTEADENGRFEFPKVPRGEYFVYALRILAGSTDITHEPLEIYYQYALTAQQIRKYSWMYKIKVVRNTTIRLDSSNMTDVFK